MGVGEIVFQLVETPLGRMVAGATDRGCCLLEFEDRGGIERILARAKKRHASVPSEGSHALIDRLERELDEYFRGSRTAFEVPLDLHGTPFQRAVWQELLKIPFAETRSYGQIARTLGKPHGGRAVGRANGDNQIAIVVPCHRVIQSDGGLRGYAGGLWRKQRLLDHETSTACLFS